MWASHIVTRCQNGSAENPIWTNKNENWNPNCNNNKNKNEPHISFNVDVLSFYELHIQFPKEKQQQKYTTTHTLPKLYAMLCDIRDIWSVVLLANFILIYLFEYSVLFCLFLQLRTEEQNSIFYLFIFWQASKTTCYI